MNWFEGDVGHAIQKAIGEKKVFIVFVKDDKESSKAIEEMWNDQTIADICTEEKCVAINITADSVPGQQFGAIYPILCVPSTYLINNQGTPTDIIPGVLAKEEFVKRLTDAIDKTLNANPATEQPSSTTNVENVESPSSSQPHVQESTEDLEKELTTQEKTQIEMLREKVKHKKEQEENEKLKEMERKRIQTGRELQMAQRQIAERQATQLAKEIADRKAEEKAAREKVREQIRRDRLEKTKKFDEEKKEKEEAQKQKTEAATAVAAEKKKVDGTIARLQFRLPDGSSISNTFNAEAKFLVAEAFVKDHVQISNIRLTTAFPKHEFNSEDAVKSFRELGLVPNACIIVSHGSSKASMSSQSSSSTSLSVMSFVMFVFAPIIAIFSWISSLFTSGGGNNNSSSNGSSNGSSSNSSESNQSNPTAAAASYSPNNPRDDAVRRRNLQNSPSPRSNIQRLRRDDDDENATWNGNSTQQM